MSDMNEEKNIEPIIGIGKNPENNIIQKSRPLISLWRSNLSLNEFKILDIYLSRINSRNPKKRVVILEKGEIEKCLGVDRIRSEQLSKYLFNLGQGIKVNDPDLPKGFRMVWLFEEIKCDQDEFGRWTVKLECSSKAMEYFFNIENIGYLRYKLRCISGLTSRYSYILFLYLEINRFRKTWEIGVNELREILNCDKEESYKQFKRFNDAILKRCQNELHEKTECRFSYEPIKKGRYVTAVKFTLKSLPQLENTENIKNLVQEWPYEKYGSPKSDDSEDNNENNNIMDYYDLQYGDNANIDDTIAFLQEACIDAKTNKPEFTKIQMEEIFSVLVDVPESLLPANNRSSNIDIKRYQYLKEKYDRMNRFSQHKPILHRVPYLIKMIKTDCGM